MNYSKPINKTVALIRPRSQKFSAILSIVLHFLLIKHEKFVKHLEKQAKMGVKIIIQQICKIGAALSNQIKTSVEKQEEDLK